MKAAHRGTLIGGGAPLRNLCFGFLLSLHSLLISDPQTLCFRPQILTGQSSRILCFAAEETKFPPISARPTAQETGMRSLANLLAKLCFGVICPQDSCLCMPHFLGPSRSFLNHLLLSELFPGDLLQNSAPPPTTNSPYPTSLLSCSL